MKGENMKAKLNFKIRILRIKRILKMKKKRNLKKQNCSCRKRRRKLENKKLNLNSRKKRELKSKECNKVFRKHWLKNKLRKWKKKLLKNKRKKLISWCSNYWRKRSSINRFNKKISHLLTNKINKQSIKILRLI
jgi:hypothetical protein